MKAGELIKQEPFAEIFTATLSRFLTLRFGGEWQVSWNATAQSSRAQSWLVNLNINAIFQTNVSGDALENTRREYATSVTAWKRPLQQFYFWLATKAAPRFMAHAFVEVEPSIPGADQCIIIPGTHKIRFIDTAKCISYCHLKTGSSQAHFQAEIEAREFAAGKGLPVPRILERLSDCCIAEQMVVGTPLNRLASRTERAEGFRRAIKAMEPLYQSTARRESLADYAKDVVCRIEAMTVIRSEIASTGSLALARRLAGTLGHVDQRIELVRSHGDFQPGNILYDRGDVWLIDWEYSGERQRLYDHMTFSTGVRFLKNLAARIIAYAGTFTDAAQLLQLHLFLLESILFDCEAVMITAHGSPPSMIARIAEYERALPFLLREPMA